MSWIDELKKWFWGDLKPELQDEPIEKSQPKVPTTTDMASRFDEVLEEEVKKKPKRRYTKTGSEKPKAAEKKEAVKKKKSRKPRKTKKKETGE